MRYPYRSFHHVRPSCCVGWLWRYQCTLRARAISFVEFFCSDEARTQDVINAGPVAFFFSQAIPLLELFLQELSQKLAPKTCAGAGRLLVGLTGSFYSSLLDWIRSHADASDRTKSHCFDVARTLRASPMLARLTADAKSHAVNVTHPRKVAKANTCRNMWRLAVCSFLRTACALQVAEKEFNQHVLVMVEGKACGDPSKVDWAWLRDFHDGMFTLLTAANGGVERSRLWTHVQVNESAGPDQRCCNPNPNPFFTRTKANGYEWSLWWPANTVHTKTKCPNHNSGNAPSLPLQQLCDFYVSKLVPLIHLKAARPFDPAQPYHLFFQNIKKALPHPAVDAGVDPLRILMKQVGLYETRYDRENKVRPEALDYNLRSAFSTALSANMMQTPKFAGCRNASGFAFERFPLYRIVERHTVEVALRNYDNIQSRAHISAVREALQAEQESINHKFGKVPHTLTRTAWYEAHALALKYGYQFYSRPKVAPNLFQLSPQARAAVDPQPSPPADRPGLVYLVKAPRPSPGDAVPADDSQHQIKEPILKGKVRPPKTCKHCGLCDHRRCSSKLCQHYKSRVTKQAAAPARSEGATPKCKCGSFDHQRTSCKLCPLNSDGAARSGESESDNENSHGEWGQSDAEESSAYNDGESVSRWEPGPIEDQSLDTSDSRRLKPSAGNGYSPFHKDIQLAPSIELLFNDKWCACTHTQEVGAGLKCFFGNLEMHVVPMAEVSDRVRSCQDGKSKHRSVTPNAETHRDPSPNLTQKRSQAPSSNVAPDPKLPVQKRSRPAPRSPAQNNPPGRVPMSTATMAAHLTGKGWEQFSAWAENDIASNFRFSLRECATPTLAPSAQPAPTPHRSRRVLALGGDNPGRTPDPKAVPRQPKSVEMGFQSGQGIRGPPVSVVVATAVVRPRKRTSVNLGNRSGPQDLVHNLGQLAGWGAPVIVVPYAVRNSMSMHAGQAVGAALSRALAAAASARGATVQPLGVAAIIDYTAAAQRDDHSSYGAWCRQLGLPTTFVLAPHALPPGQSTRQANAARAARHCICLLEASTTLVGALNMLPRTADADPHPHPNPNAVVPPVGPGAGTDIAAMVHGLLRSGCTPGARSRFHGCGSIDCTEVSIVQFLKSLDGGQAPSAREIHCWMTTCLHSPGSALSPTWYTLAVELQPPTTPASREARDPLETRLVPGGSGSLKAAVLTPLLATTFLTGRPWIHTPPSGWCWVSAVLAGAGLVSPGQYPQCKDRWRMCRPAPYAIVLERYCVVYAEHVCRTRVTSTKFVRYDLWGHDKRWDHEQYSGGYASAQQLCTFAAALGFSCVVLGQDLCSITESTEAGSLANRDWTPPDSCVVVAWDNEVRDHFMALSPRTQQRSYPDHVQQLVQQCKSLAPDACCPTRATIVAWLNRTFPDQIQQANKSTRCCDYPFRNGAVDLTCSD